MTLQVFIRFPQGLRNIAWCSTPQTSGTPAWVGMFVKNSGPLRNCKLVNLRWSCRSLILTPNNSVSGEPREASAKPLEESQINMWLTGIYGNDRLRSWKRLKCRAREGAGTVIVVQKAIDFVMFLKQNRISRKAGLGLWEKRKHPIQDFRRSRTTMLVF